MTEQTVPALFAHAKYDLFGSTEHCAVCGKKVSKDPSRVWWVATAYGADPVRDDEVDSIDPAADSGSFPVGSECAKRFPAGYLTRGEK